MAHCNVAVYTHSCQCEDACKHVVIVNRHDNLAQDVPKRPGTHEIVDTLEGEGTGSQSICQGQVKDVDVCRGLHFGVSVVNRSAALNRSSFCESFSRMIELNNLYVKKIELMVKMMDCNITNTYGYVTEYKYFIRTEQIQIRMGGALLKFSTEGFYVFLLFLPEAKKFFLRWSFGDVQL